MKKIGISLAIITIIVFSFFIYSTQILRYSIVVKETFVTSPTIPNTFDGARIIQFSDILIESETDLKILERAVEEINSLNADIVVFTGNLFKEAGFTPFLRSEVETLLTNIEASLGKIAVLGQEDLLQEESIANLLTDSSFHVLRNDSIQLYNGSINGLTFIGVNSLITDPNLASLLENHSNPDSFNILLIHEPTRAAMTTDYPIEVQLSGYCRGVNLPMEEINSSYCNQFYQGTYRFADHLLLNVNTSLKPPSHPITLLNRPTIDSFLLIRE